MARLLYTQDLQMSSPAVVGQFNTAGQQSLTMYAVGFGINSNLLKNTAAVTGWLYYSTDSGEALTQALQSILATVQLRAATCMASQ
ncbi:hypothetical protein [Hyalangium rubrum]|uniref:Uncharacterized protein n=1 Tax=Hyalangium rubrum TaxID=3103134 RepID=A0ABU5GYE9_9BACT|nr:hypothetical protein [Hyalangium sp. s54d21]MDY7225719.1 hypothetical protein [Hyalangium sp. s54d21]